MRVNNNCNNLTFGARWQEARAIIKTLPNDHDFFTGVSYTLDNRTVSTKEVLLKRLDKFAEIVKNEWNGKCLVNIEMPEISTLFHKPMNFCRGFMERWRIVEGAEPYSKTYEYPFRRTTIEDNGNGITALLTYENDSIGDVANYLIMNGKPLSTELKKFGLENPRILEF
jgi:hypothetical protein